MGSKIALFGEVKNGQFTCHIYQCETNMPDGKYWVLLELDFDTIDFTRAVNTKPEINEHQILSYATVDENGLMTADIDPEYKKKVTISTGRYYCIFDIKTIDEQLYPMENEAPALSKETRIKEAIIWVDEATGEIKYDPKKNRDDHRHHAIDAITVALTEQGYLQRLSTYHAKEENAKRGIDSTEKFPEPWDGFSNDVKKVAASLLISHKQNNKVLTKISKKIQKNGEVKKSIGFAARGQLHKETVFGKRRSPGRSEHSYHIRKDIRGLKDKKQINKVVDDTIRKRICNHLRENYGIDTSKDNFAVPKDAFYKNGEYSLLLPNNRGGDRVPIKKVRIRENIGNAIQLKNNIKQFVNPRNNHHVLIYEDFDGNLKEKVESFIEVVERKRNGAPVYQLPKENGRRIIATLEINDMFLLGLGKDIEIDTASTDLLSKHLYRVQKVSGGDYSFRFHLASTLTNDDEEVRITSIKAWKKFNPIKVKIDILGNIKRI